jgi:hypothetical protein
LGVGGLRCLMPSARYYREQAKTLSNQRQGLRRPAARAGSGRTSASRRSTRSGCRPEPAADGLQLTATPERSKTLTTASTYPASLTASGFTASVEKRGFQFQEGAPLQATHSELIFCCAPDPMAGSDAGRPEGATAEKAVPSPTSRPWTGKLRPQLIDKPERR